MGGFAVLLRKELRESWRTGRAIVVGALFLFFGFASPLFAKYLPDLLAYLGTSQGLQVTLPPPAARDAVEQFLKNLGNLAFVAILLAMGAVAREKEHGTAAFVLTKPAGRAAFLLAKFAALALLFLAGIFLAGAATYDYTAYLFAALPVGGFLAACALLTLATLVYAALTFLGSTLARSTLPAAGFGLAAYAVATVLGLLPRVGWFLPAGLYAAARALALGAAPAHLGPALLGNGGIVLSALLLAWLAFRRQELGA